MEEMDVLETIAEEVKQDSAGAVEVGSLTPDMFRLLRILHNTIPTKFTIIRSGQC